MIEPLAPVWRKPLTVLACTAGNIHACGGEDLPRVLAYIRQSIENLPDSISDSDFRMVVSVAGSLSANPELGALADLRPHLDAIIGATRAAQEAEYTRIRENCAQYERRSDGFWHGPCGEKGGCSVEAVLNFRPKVSKGRPGYCRKHADEHGL